MLKCDRIIRRYSVGAGVLSEIVSHIESE
ncbi:hypothetical protein KGM_200851A, partial [Danaus plexippus plexippus]